jgi:hypothetical protein
MKQKITSAILTLLVIASCKSIKPVKPDAAYEPAKKVYDKEMSVINIPIEISVADIEKQINSYVKGVIYEDNSYDDNGGDGMKYTVTKYSNIDLSAKGNKISITVPLKITGKYKTLGMVNSFSGTIKTSYITSITLKHDWKMATETKSDGYEWIESPALDFGVVSLPLTYVADAILDGQQEYIEKEIDAAIRQYVDLKDYVREPLNALYEPWLISETYKTWFKMEPREVYMTQIKTTEKGKNLKIGVGLKTYTETIIGEKPEKSSQEDFKNDVVPMKVVEKLDDHFSIGLVTLVSYTDAAKLLDEQYVKTPFVYEEGRRKITLTHFDMWGANDKIVVEVGVKGSINGMIYLQGIPYYDTVTRSIKLTAIDFHLDTKNKLLKSANWLAHGKFCKVMEKNMTFPIGEQLDIAKKETEAYFKNYEVSKGIFINGGLTKLETSRIYLIPDALVAVMKIEGTLRVKVDGME